eukprot:TRINITY_DN84674_c0_g1_i1.p1 TRINITY_DN84674_c0_g1~~TRINITY_DN84674_c0_g1_i1.p1  ORF type:complete len:401 (-),score=15.99 TRINITY_DN84674_c0_g1_i1:113-1315(-)
MEMKCAKQTQQKKQGKTQRTKREFWMVTMNLCKAILGATIMALPRALLELGLIAGVLMFVLVAIFTFFSLYAILYGNFYTGRQSYSEVLLSLVGRWAAVCLDVAQVLDILGILILYLIIISDVLVGDNCQGLLYDWAGIDTFRWYFSKSFVLGALCVLFIFPWLLYDHLEKLTPVSVLGTLMLVLYGITLVVVSIVSVIQGQAYTPSLQPGLSLNGIVSCISFSSLIPVVVMALICHQNLLPIVENVRPCDKSVAGLKRRSIITMVSVLLCTILLLLTSICALIIFGKRIEDDVMKNLTTAKLTPVVGKIIATIIASFIRLGFVLSLTGSYLVNALPLRSIIISYAPIRMQTRPKWLFYLTTFFILGGTYVIAVNVRSIWSVIKIIGAVCANALAFFFRL